MKSTLPSFLNTFSLSTLSFRFNALCVDINFLVDLSIWLSVSLFHLKNGLEYFTRGTSQVFIPLMRSLQQSLVSRGFLVRLMLFFSYLFVWWCLLPTFSFNWNFPFLQTFWFFSWFGSSIPSDIFFFLHFSLWAWYIFLCQIPFPYSGCIFLLFISQSPIRFHFLQTVDITQVHKMVNLLLWLIKFVALRAFPKYVESWLLQILMATTHLPGRSNGLYPVSALSCCM